mmetsp:Transcript_76714/g.197595  ORF Transcript_76714/g.197595 Transcript_76714/m.197595 type:complete len:234 (+) Transcript_76714:335-1036(+)
MLLRPSRPGQRGLALLGVRHTRLGLAPHLYIGDDGRSWPVRDARDDACDQHAGDRAGRDEKGPGKAAAAPVRGVEDWALREAVDGPDHQVHHHEIARQDHVPRRPQPAGADQRQQAAQREERAAQDDHSHHPARAFEERLLVRERRDQVVAAPEQRGDDGVHGDVAEEHGAGPPLAARSCACGALRRQGRLYRGRCDGLRMPLCADGALAAGRRHRPGGEGANAAWSQVLSQT